MTSEIDSSAKEINLRMTEGDSINFTWRVRDAADWAGEYVFSAAVGDDILTFDTTVTAESADARFALVSEPLDGLSESSSGHPWKVKSADGFTRFGGLLFVEPARC